MQRVLPLYHQVLSLTDQVSPLQAGLRPLMPCHQGRLARGHFLLARSFFPEHGLLVSSSGANSRAAPSAVLSLASATAEGRLPTVSSTQEKPKAESGMRDPSEIRPTLLGVMGH